MYKPVTNNSKTNLWVDKNNPACNGVFGSYSTNILMFRNFHDTAYKCMFSYFVWSCYQQYSYRVNI